jgi:hypothetical protein
MISEIVEAKRFHCGQIIRRMRADHLSALRRVGKNPHSELLAAFDQSSFRRSLLLDGELAAIGGVTGTTVSPIGYIWLAVTAKASAHPHVLLAAFRKALAEVFNTRIEVATTLVEGDEAGRRLAVFLGFHTDHVAEGRPAHSRADRARLNDYLASDRAPRVEIGNSFVIPVGLHPDHGMIG